ncbi:MAG: hypothetical protein ACI4QR_05060 [Eubacteriales bacterium]
MQSSFAYFSPKGEAGFFAKTTAEKQNSNPCHGFGVCGGKFFCLLFSERKVGATVAHLYCLTKNAPVGAFFFYSLF